MIVGVGVDVVHLPRFGERLVAVPRLRDRLFTEAERDLPVRSLAARFAAKEAVAKALGVPAGWSWHDVSVPRTDGRAPRAELSGAVAAAVAALGARVHLSLSHDGDAAVAMAVLEADPPQALA